MSHSPRPMRSLTLILALLSCIGLAPAIAQPQPTTKATAATPIAPAAVREHWYTVTIGGQRSGWMRDTTTTTTATITHDQEMSFSIKRERLNMTVTSHTTFIESADARPISMRLVQSMGADPTTTEYTFLPEGVQSTTITKTGRQSTMLPALKGEWLTPSRIETLLKDKIHAGEKSFTYQSVDPATGAALVTETRNETSRTTRTLDGRTIQAITYAVTNSAAPGLPMTETLDEDANVLQQEFSTGAFTILLTRSTKLEASGVFEAPEIMIATYIVPDHPIPHPRALDHAQYILSVPDGEALPLLATGAQQASRLTDHRIRLVVDSPSHAPATLNDQEKTSALAATTLADAKDEKILSLVDQATKDCAPGAPARAEAMRRFVHHYIKTKDLSVGFASASETARSAIGDCTEHGVLLAAMLRADHIPSRVASGLIYVEHLAGDKGAFGYHLWTQALLTIDNQDRWIDLDATLADSRPFDAAHIALALSDLSDTTTLTSMASIVPMLGRLTIEVLPTTPSKSSRDAR